MNQLSGGRVKAREWLGQAYAWVRGGLAKAWASVSSPPPLRCTILAVGVLLALAVAAGLVMGEIDVSKLMPGAISAAGQPNIVVQGNKVLNNGTVSALNVEITRPSYKLIGRLAPGEGFATPGAEFAVRYQWREGEKTLSHEKSFRLGGLATRHRDASTPLSTLASAAELENVDPDSLAISPEPPSGLDAYYDPTSHMLYVRARRDIAVRVDGYALRPVARSDKDGVEYRYGSAGILVLGQDLKQGQSVQFEVVFTKPQDFYSIPLYVKEPGKPPVYLTVTVSLRGGSDGA